MKQAFSSHPLMGVEPGTIDTPFVDAVVEYLAYVAFVSLAAAIAIASLGFSANVAVGFLDRIVKPSFLAAESLAVPALSKKPASGWRTTTHAAG